jgi:hypothetical protein
VAVLALAEILAWGILIYPPVLTLPHIAAAHGWSLAYCMAGFSLGLIVSGILSPVVCGLIDRHGGNIVMSSRALAGAWRRQPSSGSPTAPCSKWGLLARCWCWGVSWRSGQGLLIFQGPPGINAA